MWWKNAVKTFKTFSRETTIHGIFFLVNYKLNLLERLFWIVIITLASIGTIGICFSNWHRYSQNPTVVSIEKDFRNWNNLFPSATGCLESKVDDFKAEEFILTKWNITEADPPYDYYLLFIKAVANISYKSLNAFEKFKNDEKLKDIDMLDLAVQVHPEIDNSVITFDSITGNIFDPVITEHGICFTINSKISKLFSLRDFPIKTRKISPFRCHYLGGICYARYDGDSDKPLNFYIHTHSDLPHATSPLPYHIKAGEDLEITFRMEETSSDKNLRSLSPAQRKCRFEDEPASEDLPIYSTSVCRTLCRYRATLNLCGCRPYFYYNLKGKICDVGGLVCVAKFAQEIIDSSSKSSCACPQQCDVIMYIPQTSKISHWSYGFFDEKVIFRWGLLPPKTKYRRKIMFGFEDLVVSFGGTASLFLGVSFISIIELIYYLAKCIFNF